MPVGMKNFENPLSDDAPSDEEMSGTPRSDLGAGSSSDPVAKEAPGEAVDKGLAHAVAHNFLGHSPGWYKVAILVFLLLNVVLRFAISKKAAAWAVLLEFVFTLAMGTQSYPLMAGGLVVIEAFVLGLASPEKFKHEVEINTNVLLLVIFMVACIHFLKHLLLWIFINMLIKIQNKVALSVAIMLVSAFMSAFLDALSVAAVVVSVCTGILGVYYQVSRPFPSWLRFTYVTPVLVKKY
jgi:NhaB family Na+:H+ antiporter